MMLNVQAPSILDRANNLVGTLTRRMSQPPAAPKGTLYTGVDLGTAYVVLTVVDQSGAPVDAAYTFAQVVRDGLVVDYVGAVNTVRRLKTQLEERLGCELLEAAAAYPPGTGPRDIQTHQYVTEAAGFEVTEMVDEVMAANRVLGIQNGAVVDIGGGTTGVAVLQDGKVVHIADEPTGGTHFSLVVAGAHKISFDEAEELKKDPAQQRQVLRLVTPVIQKVASIVHRHIAPYDVDAVYVVGGTARLSGFEDVMTKELGLPVLKPEEPLLVTPLGIAMAAVKSGDTDD